jgi:GcrA cell cycle regulator
MRYGLPREQMYAWPDEAKELLEKLWKLGFSAADVAAQLPTDSRGNRPTRNSVIGMVHRSGLSGRAKTRPEGAEKADAGKTTRIRAAAAERPAQAPRAVPPSVPSVPRIPKEAPRPLKLSILDLTNESCRYIYGETSFGGEHYYCGVPGADMIGRRPYCPFHENQCWTSAAKARAAKATSTPKPRESQPGLVA